MIKQLGPYRVERILGRGGMGTVYAGIHTTDGSRAAIKILSLGIADDANFRERFLAEIETLKKLNHPNIVRLLGDGQQDGHLFYVMELVEGRSLQAELQAKYRFEWPEVRAIGLDVCRALRHAHDRGIVHRDLKPANLLRGGDGVVKLTDFGIAKLFGGSHLTADGSVVGTADYMSPEQAEGKPVTPRTDLYSLGSVLFTLLARRPPFSAGSVAQVVHKLRFEEAPPVGRYAPQVPADLERIIEELLRKDPAERIANVAVLSNRLAELGNGPGELPATVIEPPQAGELPATRVSPTAVDPGSKAQPLEEFSWNEATVVTSGDSGEAMRVAAEDRELAERQDHFTELDEQTRQAADVESAEKRGGEWGQVAALAILLGCLIAGTVWFLRPPTAEELYGKIQAVVVAEGPEAAKGEIDRFLTRFPNDPRWQEVERLRMDVECDWLRSRLALRDITSGGSKLLEHEREALEAMRAGDRNPAAAVDALRAYLERFEDEPNPSPSLQECLTAIRHLLQEKAAGR